MICSTPKCENVGVFIYEKNKSYCVDCRNKAHANIIMSKPLLSQFEEDLYAVVEEYNNQGLSLGETIGAIEMTKLRVWHNQVIDDEDEDEFS